MSAVEAEACADTLTFAQERTATAIGEIDWLMRAHWDEVGFYRDMPIDPDFDQYREHERRGALRLYTVRCAGHLVGYATYVIGHPLHYRTVLSAQQATLFLHPEYRRGRAGVKFIAYTELLLGAEGVQVVIQHVKLPRGFKLAGGLRDILVRLTHGFAALLERRGYELQDLLYTKRL